MSRFARLLFSCALMVAVWPATAHADIVVEPPDDGCKLVPLGNPCRYAGISPGVCAQLSRKRRNGVYRYRACRPTAQASAAIPVPPPPAAEPASSAHSRRAVPAESSPAQHRAVPTSRAGCSAATTSWGLPKGPAIPLLLLAGWWLGLGVFVLRTRKRQGRQ